MARPRQFALVLLCATVRWPVGRLRGSAVSTGPTSNIPQRRPGTARRHPGTRNGPVMTAAVQDSDARHSRRRH